MFDEYQDNRALTGYIGIVSSINVKQLCTKLLLWAASKTFVRNALIERADLSAFKGRPSLAVVLGVSAIGLSFLIGWPAIAALGALALKWHTPWVAVVGGPLLYGLSHLVFLLGMSLSGTYYSLVFARWLIRVTMEWALLRLAPEQLAQILPPASLSPSLPEINS